MPLSTTMAITLPMGVDQLIAVANTRHGPAGHWHARVTQDAPDHDHLARPDDAVAFLAGHGVPVPAGTPGPGVLAALGVLATEVRSLAADPERPWPAPPLVALLRSATYRYGPDGRLRGASADPWRALVEELLPAAMALGAQRDRLRTCGNPLCRFAFLDRSRNRSRVWCDPGGCGNRAKVRRYRRRHRKPSGLRAVSGHDERRRPK